MTGLCLLCPLPISVLVVTGLCPIMHYGQYPLLLNLCVCVCPLFIAVLVVTGLCVFCVHASCSTSCYCTLWLMCPLAIAVMVVTAMDFVVSVSTACCSTCCQWTSWFLCLLPVAVLVVTRLHAFGVYAMLVQIPVVSGLNVFGLQ